MHVIVFAGEEMHLLPQRALFRPSNQTLYIADAHWGKVATFQAYNVPLPDGQLSDDLSRLSAVLEATGAERLVILGDLIHSQFTFSDRVIEVVSIWRARHLDLKIELIEGNHDRYIRFLPPHLDIVRVDPGVDDSGILLHHEPLNDVRQAHFCGHLHPGWRLQGKGRQSIALPSFVITQNQLLFPAFGTLTGLMCRYKRKPTHVYLVGPEKVYQVK
ncbi:MAG: ligase-associated DNA damage response endonuclease PdeM [Chloroflexota bacterium]